MNFAQFTDVVTPLLQEAGALILQMMHEGSVVGNRKADATPVTAIDIAVEEHIKQKIKAAFPAHGIIGEESESHQPEAEYCWTIDPIDGTRALMAGFASFTTLLALTHHGKPLFGASYQPITQELWLGDGTRATLSGQPLRTRPCPALAQAMLSTTSPLLFSPEKRPIIEQIMQEAMAYQLGGDAYAYGKLAAGRIDLIIESGLKPHDFMALVPIIQGAGGTITDWQNQPLTLSSNGNICVAGDTALHTFALQKLKTLS